MAMLSYVHQLFSAEQCQAYIHTLRWEDRPLPCPRCHSYHDKQGIVRGFWDQRPVNPDELWAPDPLFSSEPVLDLAREIVKSP